jgi:hypothetical protein
LSKTNFERKKNDGPLDALGGHHTLKLAGLLGNIASDVNITSVAWPSSENKALSQCGPFLGNPRRADRAPAGCAANSNVHGRFSRFQT